MRRCGDSGGTAAERARASSARPNCILAGVITMLGKPGSSWKRVALGIVLAAHAAPLGAQPLIEPEGAEELALALRRLGTTRRVLMIGAHPDDENTAVLAQLGLGGGADVAYLSLTRGEGGQNLIGPELQEGLGLIRSEELLSARTLDGAQQFFTRAYDFGFSRSAEETFEHWPKDTLLADVVAVVRRFRPDVMVAVFSGTPRDGHGHHQASGILAREAFGAAADSTRFAGQRAWGLRPHRARYLFQALYRGDPEGAFPLETGDFDPALGRSYFQVAMASRSRHRSQDMGMPQPPGPRSTLLLPVDGDFPEDARSPFAGLDTTLSQRAQAGNASRELIDLLVVYEREAAAAQGAFNPLNTRGLIEPLANAIAVLDSAAALLPAEDPLAFHVGEERDEAADALRRAAGFVLDATADRQHITPAGELVVDVSIWNGGDEDAYVSALRPVLPGDEKGPDSHARWTVEALDSTDVIAMGPDSFTTRRFRIRISQDARFTEPYYLRAERETDLYAWPDDEPWLRGLPFEPPPVRVAAEVAIRGATLSAMEEATVPEIDKSLGELRHPVFVVPVVSLEVSPAVLVVPRNGPDSQDDGQRPRLSVALRTEDRDITGDLTLDLPAGWKSEPDRIGVTFGERNQRTFSFELIPPSSMEGEVRIRARFRDGSTGREYDRGYQLIAYPHTRPRTLYSPAMTRVASFPVTIADGLRIGYIEGAGDDGREALRQLGGDIELVSETELAGGDLSRYDVIVAGIRAYEVRPDLVANNARVLTWVRNGGTFIVQYNKYELVEGGFTPFPLTMAQPHGRVTDETAPVRLLASDHPVLSWPNRIGPGDFEGWEQERGLYFAETWDANYTPLLEMADPGQEPQRGSLLVADVGEGHYAYTGLALFRQLPAAVPGAYRLLANLVSMGRAPR